MAGIPEGSCTRGAGRSVGEDRPDRGGSRHPRTSQRPGVPGPPAAAEREAESVAGLGSGATLSAEAYEAVFRKVYDNLQRTHRELRDDRASVEDRLHRLLMLPPARRRLLIRNSAQVASWALAERLIEQSVHRGPATALRGVELAELAVECARTLARREPTNHLLADLEARAWAAVGVCLRFQPEPRGDDAFRRAWEALGRGSGDRLERASLQQMWAAYLMQQGRPAMARELLRFAVETLFRVGALSKARHAAIALGLVEEHLGAGRGLAQRALEALALEEDPEDACPILRHNLALLHLARGHRFEARRQVHALRRARRSDPETIDLTVRLERRLHAAGPDAPGKALDRRGR